MTDSVPAPMVQLPADTVEKLRELVQLPHMPEGSEWYEATLAVVDAATPAASVLAADILALADERDKQAEESLSRMFDGSPFPALVSTGELRALVGVAEQADKGEAADTPRDDDLFDDLRGHPDDTPMSGEAAIQYAPAAPPEPVCRCCGPTPYPGTDAPMEDCPIHYPPAVPPRVPVNDEAEAAWQSIQPAWFGDSETAFKAGYLAHAAQQEEV